MEFYGIIGDVDPITHDGGVVFARDKDSSPEVIYFFGWEDEVKGETVERVTVYRFSLDEDLSWVDWNAVASSIGIDEEELKSQAVSDDMLTRAWAYQSAAQHHGFRYLDETPEELTLEEAEEEYGYGVDQAAEALKPTAPKKKATSRRKNPADGDGRAKRMMNPRNY